MLPLTTTTVTIKRRSQDVDPYEDQTVQTVGSGVPGVISGSSGSGSRIGGAQQVLSPSFYGNEDTDVLKGDILIDETNEEVWHVLWVRKRYELGLGHVVAGLEQVTGAVP